MTDRIDDLMRSDALAQAAKAAQLKLEHLKDIDLLRTLAKEMRAVAETGPNEGSEDILGRGFLKNWSDSILDLVNALTERHIHGRSIDADRYFGVILEISKSAVHHGRWAIKRGYADLMKRALDAVRDIFDREHPFI